MNHRHTFGFPRSALVRCLLALLFSLLFCTSVAADQQAELKRLQESIDTLQKELKNIQGNRSTLQQQLERSETEMGELLKKIDQIQQDLKEHNQQLDQLQEERQQLESARREQSHQIADQIRTAYRMGHQNQVQLLLNQESPERFSRLLGYHQRLLQVQQDKLGQYLATLDQLDQLEPRILARRTLLANTRASLAKQQEQLQQRQQVRQQTLAKLNNNLQTKDAELRQLQEDRQRLQRLVQEVARTIGNIPLPTGNEAFSNRKGKLPWPAQGRVLSRYGSPRIGGQTQWNGLLIGSNIGQPVIAVHHGRVVFADYFRGHGLLIIIDHGEGYLSLYAHNQQLLRSTGDWVNAGDAVARVGNSGGQEQAGLYFEIRHQGKPTDPGTWLARA